MLIFESEHWKLNTYIVWKRRRRQQNRLWVWGTGRDCVAAHLGLPPRRRVGGSPQSEPWVPTPSPAPALPPKAEILPIECLCWAASPCSAKIPLGANGVCGLLPPPCWPSGQMPGMYTLQNPEKSPKFKIQCFWPQAFQIREFNLHTYLETKRAHFSQRSACLQCPD